MFEDTVIFARCLARWIEKGKAGGNPKEAFEAYEALRKPRIAIAYDESQTVIQTVADAGWLGHLMKTKVIPWYLWWTRIPRNKHFVEDVTQIDLNY